MFSSTQESHWYPRFREVLELVGFGNYDAEDHRYVQLPATLGRKVPRELLAAAHCSSKFGTLKYGLRRWWPDRLKLGGNFRHESSRKIFLPSPPMTL